MTTSTPTNEGNAIAGTMIAQAKGDVHAARRVAGEAHACLTKIAVALDPTFKPSDDAARIVELETQLRDVMHDAGDDAINAVIVERDAARQVVVELTSARADLDDRCDVLRRDLDTVRIERNNLSRSITALGERVLDTERQRDNFRDELTRVKAELAQVRAVNFDAPRVTHFGVEHHGIVPEAAPAQVVEVVAPVVVEPMTDAETLAVARGFTPPRMIDEANAEIAARRVVRNDAAAVDSQRPATVSEAAWASMSPMMQKFAAARAAVVK